MRLTKKRAIDITIELWEWLAETGAEKEDWPGWEKYGEMECDCALCEYDKSQAERTDSPMCSFCPLYTGLGMGCDHLAYGKWGGAKTPKTCKKYALLFLEQLRRLKK